MENNRNRSRRRIGLIIVTTILIVAIAVASVTIHSWNDDHDGDTQTVSDSQQSDNESASSAVNDDTPTSQNADNSNDKKINTMNITINGTTLTATMEDNSSAQALLDMLKSSPLTLDMHDYASMEKVGTLNTTIPTNDQQITTQPGDIILYQGNQITIYYDNNQWNLTRLGHIDNVTAEKLRQLLGGENVTVTLSV